MGFFVRPRSNILGVELSLLGAGLCYAYFRTPKQQRASRSIENALTAGKLLFGIAVLAECFVGPAGDAIRPLSYRLPHFWMLPFAWLVVAGEEAGGQTQLARLYLVAVLVTQPLIAYPVAGTQLGPATVLVSVAAALSLADALRAVPEVVHHSFCGKHAFSAAGLIGAIVLLFLFCREAIDGRRKYASFAPLDLPGACRVRLKAEDVQTYQGVVNYLASPHIESFLTIPGMNSLYFWAGKEPPTQLNASDWLALLDPRQQERVWEAAQKIHGLVVVRNRGAVHTWMRSASINQVPFVKHIDQDFQVEVTIGGFEILIRR